jgi:electron transfer flavoprotein alpha subunit
VAKALNIWVLPEISGREEEFSKLSLGILTEARYVAEKVGGTVTALVLGDQPRDLSDDLGRYGIARSYIFQDHLLKYYSAEAYAAALLPRIQTEKPWLFLMGNTAVGRGLASRLAALLDTGVITNCAKTDLSRPEQPKFYRPVYGDQLYQEVVFQTDRTMLVTMDTRTLDVAPPARPRITRSLIIESKLSPDSIKTRHLEYLPADFQTVDVADADTVISAGMGAATDELLPMVEELAGLIEGAIGTTRPVVDGGKIPRERMIGQTGKVVSPEFYLALGISGATHHVGGIQESGKIVAVNRDPQAPIFQSSDVGVAADLKEVLPVLIERIKRAKENGEIL